MQDPFTRRGVPRALLTDAWWLETAGDPPPAAPPRSPPRWPLAGLADQGLPGRLLVLAALVLLADLLFWGRELGLSLALFAGAVLAAAMAVTPDPARRMPAAAVLALGVLPAVELVQPLSVAILAVALATALVLLDPRSAGPALAAGALRLLGRLPWAGVAALLRGLGGIRTRPGGEPVLALRRALRGWAFPLGGTLVFAALLADANPVLERWLSLELDLPQLARRALFWTGIALLVAPLLEPPAPATALRLPRLRLPGLGINAASSLRALVMFNLLIGVQTVMDLSIFLGGARLPEGLGYAEYAHRGAYPLLATALLAGAFALAAHPFLDERRSLRPLMLLWLGQNVALCLSALLRLDLYVEAYGLTYLRSYAFVWMLLVAAGLALTLWQVARRLSLAWLVLRTAALAAGTLYLCAFVNFAAIIAQTNLARWPDTDHFYVCRLGPTAAGVLAQAVAKAPPDSPLRTQCSVRPPRIEGWRDWGFRNWRVARYAAAADPEPLRENPAGR